MVISVIVFLALLAIYVRSNDDPRGVIDIQASPNNQLVAYSYHESGGGPGYCSFSIAVIKLGGEISLLKFHSGYSRVFEIESCAEGFKFNWFSSDDVELHIYCPDSEYELRSMKLYNFENINISYNNC